MNTEDMIRRYLMLHPDTSFDMTEYAFPLRAVKQLLETAVATEREACALICDSHADDPVYCGEAIRARGQA